jgi:acetyltransferase-like isoleucine patch superfamily enzyme
MATSERKDLSTVLHEVAYYIKGSMVGSLRARLSGAESFGASPTIVRGVKFEVESGGRLTVGDRFRASGAMAGTYIKVAPGATLTMGDDVGINWGVSIEAWHEVRIGSNVLIASYASIIDDNRHLVQPDSVRYPGPVIIGNNVWLGRNVAVMPGVTIGDGSVIGANSVVTKDIPPKVFAAGAPAKVIRELELPDGWVRHGQPPAPAKGLPQTV